MKKLSGQSDDKMATTQNWRDQMTEFEENMHLWQRKVVGDCPDRHYSTEVDRRITAERRVSVLERELREAYKTISHLRSCCPLTR